MCAVSLTSLTRQSSLKPCLWNTYSTSGKSAPGLGSSLTNWRSRGCSGQSSGSVPAACLGFTSSADWLAQEGAAEGLHAALLREAAKAASRLYPQVRDAGSQCSLCFCVLMQSPPVATFDVHHTEVRAYGRPRTQRQQIAQASRMQQAHHNSQRQKSRGMSSNAVRSSTAACPSNSASMHSMVTAKARQSGGAAPSCSSCRQGTQAGWATQPVKVV